MSQNRELSAETPLQALRMTGPFLFRYSSKHYATPELRRAITDSAAVRFARRGRSGAGYAVFLGELEEFCRSKRALLVLNATSTTKQVLDVRGSILASHKIGYTSVRLRIARHNSSDFSDHFYGTFIGASLITGHHSSHGSYGSGRESRGRTSASKGVSCSYSCS